VLDAGGDEVLLLGHDVKVAVVVVLREGRELVVAHEPAKLVGDVKVDPLPDDELELPQLVVIVEPDLHVVQRAEAEAVHSAQC
jgi:hypothetical protein